MKFAASLAAGLLLVLGSEFVRAEKFLVNWGGDYLDLEASGKLLNLGPETFISDANGHTIGVGFAYNDTVPLSPEDAQYNLNQPSATFYGVLQVMNPRVPETGDSAKMLRSFSQVKALKRENAVGFGAPGNQKKEFTEIMGLVYWQKEDFLEGAEAAVSWSQIQSMHVNVPSVNSRGGAGSVRFAARNGDTWYLSEDESKKSGPFMLHDSLWGEWKEFGDGFPLPPVPEEFADSGDKFTNITALGVFFRASSSDPEINAVFTFNSFQVLSQP